MKKFLSILLAALMMLSAFAGCSDEKPEEVEPPKEGESEIVVSALQKSFTAVIYDSGEDEAFWKEVKAAFESANQGITINMVISKDAAYEVRDRILAGNSPDFVYLPSSEESGVTTALIKDKALLSLESVESSAPDGIFENNLCKPFEDGVSYLAPLFVETEGLIYNKETLSSNGFSVPQTWDDFIAIAKACDNKNIKFFTYAGAEPEEYVNIFAAALTPAIGTSEMNKLLACEEEAWKNDAVKTFVEKIESVTKLVVSGSSTKTKEDTLENLKDGKALFISGNGKDLEELNKDGEKYAICNYPSLSGSSVQTVSFTEMYIPVEAKEAETAKQFMSFLYSETVANLAKDKLGKEIPVSGTTVIAPEFTVKSASNATLSDEFCGLIVDVFKGNVTSEKFAEKMLEYIKEY
ncbi:MAG: extracellular solute-binding protein [Oscillospiraceae bacterium]|nr:extracellular solute-binding protein [Oscillospiraceae bacterium]MBQ5322123.1 extracellular solute-binding protein [Oscillospiraceae bacterium]